jgi:oxygen-independent coproporphyrinogen-3 oxidase
LQKCLYCDFPSYAGFSEEVRQQYVDALCREIETRSLQRDLPVAQGATVYFGGGTPTVLSVEQLGQIVNCLKQSGFWNESAEATIEANPGTVHTEKLKALREFGFDRISLGVQSLQEKELRALGRIHTADQALRAIEETKQAGLQRINADLMSGIPGQTVESFRHTLDRILQLNLSHLSVYSLILEEGTQLERLVGEGKVTLPDEEASGSMYEMTTDFLARAGLRRYEISNYAEPGQESLHNKVYWHYEPYAAFGVGACSFTGKERRTNTFDVREYIERWSTAEAVLQNSGPWQTERLDIRTQISEAMIMGLRLTEGIDLNKMQQRFGIDVLKYYGQEIQTLLDKKMAACEAGMLRLTPYGMQYGNQAFEAFV